MAIDTSKKIYVQDVTMRDGMHAIRHQYGVDKLIEICRALDQAGVSSVEVSHGDGLAGMSFNYGFAKHSDREYLEAAAGALDNAVLATLLIPASAPSRTSRNPTTPARGRCGSRRTAPRPTSPSSISNTRASSAWTSPGS